MTLQVGWTGVQRWRILSSPFSVTNGVQQGGVLSPVLFTVYIDELLQVCKNLVWVVNGKGCLLVVSVMQMISFDCTLCSCAQKDASSLFRFCLRKPWHLVQGKLNLSVCGCGWKDIENKTKDFIKCANYILAKLGDPQLWSHVCFRLSAHASSRHFPPLRLQSSQ